MSSTSGYRAGQAGTRGKTGKTAKTGQPSGKDSKVGIKDAKELFTKRINICSVTYDYTDDTKDAKAKQDRNTAL